MLGTEMNQCAAIAKVFVGHTALAQLSQSSSKLNFTPFHSSANAVSVKVVFTFILI